MSVNHNDPIRREMEVIAVGYADAIRERLIAHTPVMNHHDALILAYTRQGLNSLQAIIDQFELQVPTTDIADKLSRELEVCTYFVPMLSVDNDPSPF